MTFERVKKLLEELEGKYIKDGNKIKFGDVIDIMLDKNKKYYVLPILNQKDLIIEYSMSNPLAGQAADKSLKDFPVPLTIFCQKVRKDEDGFVLSKEEEKKLTPEQKREYIPPYYPLSRLLNLLIQLTFDHDLVYCLGIKTDCTYLSKNLNNKSESYTELIDGAPPRKKTKTKPARPAIKGLKEMINENLQKAYGDGATMTPVRLVYTLVKDKLYFIDLNRRLFIAFRSASEETVADMAVNQGEDWTYLPVIYLNHENTIVSNFNLSMVENSELMNRTAGLILNDSYFSKPFKANTSNLFFAEVLLRQGTLELKGIPFLEPYTSICITGPKPLNRILGNYLVTGVSHSIGQGTFKTNLEVMGIEIYGVQKKSKPEPVIKLPPGNYFA